MKKTALFILAVGALLLVSCSQNMLKIKSTNVEKEIGLYQNIVITFNKNVCPEEMLNQWDSLNYLTIDPPVFGRFTWTASDELTFSPAMGFAPATHYKARLNPEAFAVFGKELKVSDKEFQFNTTLLDLHTVNCFWNMYDGQKCIQFQLQFNYEVLPESLRNLMKIKLDGKIYEAVILSELDRGNIACYVVYPDESNPSNAVIEIAKGLTCTSCGMESQGPITAEVMVPSLLDFAVTSFETNTEVNAATVTLYTSQPVDDANLKKFITVKPEVKNLEISAISGGILIKGAFDQAQNYTVTALKGLKSKFNIELKDDYQNYVSFVEPSPFLSFEDKNATYLSLKGERNLVLNAAGIKTVKLSVFKVYENNIINYMDNGLSWDWEYEDDEWYEYTHWSKNRRYGDDVFSKEILISQLSSDNNGRYLLKINPEEIGIDSQYKGMYIITVEDKERAWLQTSITLSMSDLGLVMREGLNGLMACAVSIQNGQPLSGVKITLISTNNQVITSEITNSEGIVNFDTKKMNGFHVGMVTGRKGEDYNFLQLDRSEVNTSRYELSGKRTENIDFDVFMYGDRQLYRPGDSIHINAIVRGWNFDVINDVAVVFKVQNPLGENVEKYRKTLNSTGSATLSFVVPTYAPTGTWNVVFENAAGVVQQNYEIKVEEFMPDRIKVTAHTDKKQYMLKESIKLNVEALNLYGPPAVGRRYETELNIVRKSFYAEKYNNYSFGISEDNSSYINEVREGVTDNEGQFKESFDADLHALSGAYYGSIFTTVFDENGRPVNRLNRFDLFTQNTFLGIKYNDYWYGTSTPIRFDLIAVNTAGELSKADGVRAVIERTYYETVQTRVSGSNRFEYRSQKKAETVFDKKISINGNNDFITYTPKISGSYELKLYLQGSSCYTSSSFYCYGYDATSNSSFAVDKEGSIKIELDKKEYHANEKAKILFTAPFSGKLLVTVERDQVLDYFWLTLDNKSASMDLNLKGNYMPNCYITATAFRDLGVSNSAPLTIARGYENITVRNKSDVIAIKIDAPEKVRSNQKQTIKLKGTPNSAMTVAIVDEGILQITHHQTPDPYNYFYGKRALETRSFDIYPFLFREASFGKSTSGGDAAFSMDQMINPMQNKRVKLVTFWSGVINTNSSGTAEFTVDIPQFSGSLRIMAVSWKGKTFGSETANMTVADPIVISSGIPRFFSPGDQPKIPVVLRNTTEKEANVKVSLSVSSLLSIQGEKEASVKIKPGGEATCYFDIMARNDIGEAEIEVKAQAFSETFTEKTDISIRPAAGYTSEYNGGIVTAGTPFSVNAGAGFVPSTVSTNLMLSRNLATQYAGALSDVMHYPYGCLEQITSRAFPLLYLDDLASTLEKGKTGGQTPRYVINESIKQIMSMRNSDGGLSYWPNGNSYNMWSECYAAHFLTEAMKAGYTVDADFMKTLLLHISTFAKKQQMEEYTYWDSQSQSYKKYQRASKTSIYGLYVLALNGKQEISQMNFYKGSAKELTPDARCLLAATYAAIGDMPSCNHLLSDTESTPKTMASSGGDFSSYIRNNALILNCLVEAAPNDPRIPALAMQLSKEVQKSYYLSTQEKAFTLLAFGKLARKSAGSSVTANVTFNGKNIVAFDGKNATWKSAKGDIGPLNITAQGAGDLYFFVETSGIPTGGVKETDNNLKVRKRFLDRDGREINLSNVSQGDLIYVELYFETTNTLRVENVAIQDILPACFEIENARLTDVQQRSFMKSQRSYDYQDIRDDRITFFTTVTPTSGYFYYAVRAVSTGKYIMGPATATAMYDGNYSSTYGKGEVTVK